LIDGKWRAPDSLGYNEHIGAVAALVSQHLEEALTARFGGVGMVVTPASRWPG
jgi:hypothetical protein